MEKRPFFRGSIGLSAFTASNVAVAIFCALFSDKCYLYNYIDFLFSHSHLSET